MNTVARLATSLAVLSLCSVIGTVYSQAEETVSDSPAIVASSTRQSSATVTAIDYDTREVTLANADGSEITFSVLETSPGFETVGVGDTVSARYYQRTEVRLITDDAEQLQSKGVGAVARSAEGETPYLTTVDVEQFAATITAIDIEAGTFKLRDDVGTVEEFTAERPEYLQRAEVGDRVVFTVEEINYMGLEKASNVRD